MDTTHELLYLDMKFCTVKDRGYTCKLYFNHYFLGGAFEYCGGSEFLGYVGTNAEPLCV
jgi:hypothetical protein